MRLMGFKGFWVFMGFIGFTGSMGLIGFTGLRVQGLFRVQV